MGLLFVDLSGWLLFSFIVFRGFFGGRGLGVEVGDGIGSSYGNVE